MTSTTATIPDTGHRSTVGRHRYRTALAVIAAGGANLGLAAAARAAGIPLEAPPGEPIPPIAFAQATVVASLVGLAVAAVLRRRARRPVRTFTIVAVATTALSL